MYFGLKHREQMVRVATLQMGVKAVSHWRRQALRRCTDQWVLCRTVDAAR